MIKIKIVYNENYSTSIKEVLLPAIPNKGDELCFRFEKTMEESRYFTVESIEHWIEDGNYSIVIVYLIDEI